MYPLLVCFVSTCIQNIFTIYFYYLNLKMEQGAVILIALLIIVVVIALILLSSSGSSNNGGSPQPDVPTDAGQTIVPGSGPATQVKDACGDAPNTQVETIDPASY
jgi:hypothetical protein